MTLWGGIRKAFLFSRPSLIFFVTGRCSGKCLHCFSYQMDDKSELSPTQVRDFAISLGPVQDLSISGGEPLRRNDLVELLAPLFEIGKAKTCTLPTSGLYPKKTVAVLTQLALRFGKTRTTLSLPLEGDKKLHDKIRGIPGAFEKLKMTAKAIEPLVNAGIVDFKLVSTISSMNENQIDKIIQVAKTNFPNATFHHFEPMRGQGRDPNVKPPNSNVLEKTKELIFQYWEGYKGFYGGLHTLAIEAKREIFEIEIDVLKGRALPFKCLAHEMGLVLYPNGDVAFCEMTPVIGNINKEPLSGIIRGVAAGAVIEEIEKGCSCTHSCFLPKSFLGSPTNVGKVVKKRLFQRYRRKNDM